MPKARVKIEITEQDTGWQAMNDLIAELAQTGIAVEVGVLEGTPGGDEVDEHGVTNAEKAAYNEFGTVRAPARPFITETFEIYKNDYVAMMKGLLVQMLGRTISGTSAFAMIGDRIVRDIRRYVITGSEVPPPNAPSTLARKLAKGILSPRTLLDTGRMVAAITHRVVFKRRSSEGSS